jgi:hypothetical protein
MCNKGRSTEVGIPIFSVGCGIHIVPESFTGLADFSSMAPDNSFNTLTVYALYWQCL